MPVEDEDLGSIIGAFVPVDMAQFGLIPASGEGGLARVGVLYGTSADLSEPYVPEVRGRALSAVRTRLGR